MSSTLMILQAAAAVATCEAPEHRQLDFWLGRWEVRETAGGALVGESQISRAFKGCALQEQFAGADGFEGGSVNLWDRTAREWVQFGTGSTGARRLFAGRWDGARMSLLSQQPRADAVPLLIRMYLQPAPGGGVRQWSESSGDHGATWRTRYDYTYVRKD